MFVVTLSDVTKPAARLTILILSNYIKLYQVADVRKKTIRVYPTKKLWVTKSIMGYETNRSRLSGTGRGKNLRQCTGDSRGPSRRGRENINRR